MESQSILRNQISATNGEKMNDAQNQEGEQSSRNRNDLNVEKSNALKILKNNNGKLEDYKCDCNSVDQVEKSNANCNEGILKNDEEKIEFMEQEKDPLLNQLIIYKTNTKLGMKNVELCNNVVNNHSDQTKNQTTVIKNSNLKNEDTTNQFDNFIVNNFHCEKNKNNYNSRKQRCIFQDEIVCEKLKDVDVSRTVEKNIKDQMKSRKDKELGVESFLEINEESGTKQMLHTKDNIKLNAEKFVQNNGNIEDSYEENDVDIFEEQRRNKLECIKNAQNNTFKKVIDESSIRKHEESKCTSVNGNAYFDETSGLNIVDRSNLEERKIAEETFKENVINSTQNNEIKAEESIGNKNVCKNIQKNKEDMFLNETISCKNENVVNSVNSIKNRNISRTSCSKNAPNVIPKNTHVLSQDVSLVRENCVQTKEPLSNSDVKFNNKMCEMFVDVNNLEVDVNKDLNDTNSVRTNEFKQSEIVNVENKSIENGLNGGLKCILNENGTKNQIKSVTNLEIKSQMEDGVCEIKKSEHAFDGISKKTSKDYSANENSFHNNQDKEIESKLVENNTLHEQIKQTPLESSYENDSNTYARILNDISVNGSIKSTNNNENLESKEIENLHQIMTKVNQLNSNLKVVFHTPQTTPVKLSKSPVQSHPLDNPYVSEPMDLPGSPTLDVPIENMCLIRKKRNSNEISGNGQREKKDENRFVNCHGQNQQQIGQDLNKIGVLNEKKVSSTINEDHEMSRSGITSNQICQTKCSNNGSRSKCVEHVEEDGSIKSKEQDISPESYLKKYDDINAKVRAYLNKTNENSKLSDRLFEIRDQIDINERTRNYFKSNNTTNPQMYANNSSQHFWKPTETDGSCSQSFRKVEEGGNVELRTEAMHKLDANVETISSARGCCSSSYEEFTRSVTYLSDDEDASIYDTIVQDDCAGVKLVKNKPKMKLDLQERQQRREQTKKKLLLAEDLFDGNLLDDEDIRSLADDDIDELLSPNGDADSDDAFENSILEQLESSSSCSSLEDERSKVGIDGNGLSDDKWKTFSIGGLERRIDMKVIEPYKRVLSHGGYLNEECHNAIAVFSACFLPHRSRADYHYVMDNLFFYVVYTLNELITEDYVLVYLHGATCRNNMPHFSWLKKCYRMMDRKLKKSLKRLYLVDATFWLKTIVLMSKPFISSKFGKKIEFVSGLSELYEQVPSIQRASVPEKVKQYEKIKYSIREKKQ